MCNNGERELDCYLLVRLAEVEKETWVEAGREIEVYEKKSLRSVRINGMERKVFEHRGGE